MQFIERKKNLFYWNLQLLFKKNKCKQLISTIFYVNDSTFVYKYRLPAHSDVSSTRIHFTLRRDVNNVV